VNCENNVEPMSTMTASVFSTKNRILGWLASLSPVERKT